MQSLVRINYRQKAFMVVAGGGGLGIPLLIISERVRVRERTKNKSLIVPYKNQTIYTKSTNNNKII